ncbi:MAG: MarR family transcriptional regulator [Holophagales bacterium]|nr:MarR family transcriptional regulator [Holophagales bacterium]
MSTPPLPAGLDDTRLARIANQLHSTAIHLLRRVRTVDRATGLTAERLSLLSVLAFAGPKTVGELAQAEEVSRPAISRIVSGLEQTGLARRERPAGDRRRVLVHATPKGRSLMDAGRRRRLERIVEELSRLDDGQLAALESALDVLESLEHELTDRG